MWISTDKNKSTYAMLYVQIQLKKATAFCMFIYLLNAITNSTIISHISGFVRWLQCSLFPFLNSLVWMAVFWAMLFPVLSGSFTITHSHFWLRNDSLIVKSEMTIFQEPPQEGGGVRNRKLQQRSQLMKLDEILPQIQLLIHQTFKKFHLI